MNDVIEKENIKIENMIYKISGVLVILNCNLAKLYECTKKTIKGHNIKYLPYVIT